MAKITIVSQQPVGKAGASRTVHHLSNGWYINETNNHKRGDRFALYMPGNPTPTFVRGDSKLKRLVKLANDLAQD